MNRTTIIADELFNGISQMGAVAVLVENGIIKAVQPVDGSGYGEEISNPFGDIRGTMLKSAFLMPGLVEAHAHLFLDGDETDFDQRREYLQAPFDNMLEVGRRNLTSLTAAGITLVRDAGDRFGVNHSLRREAIGNFSFPTVRSPGCALRYPKRYGSFMGIEIDSPDSVRAAIADLAKQSDDIKIIVSDIIDFVAGNVTKPPQFSQEALSFIIEEAKKYNLKTFVHCSGIAGLEIAVKSGVDSIEHGFFMAKHILEIMADKGIAWVPTFSPVHMQWKYPSYAGWDQATRDKIANILSSHANQLMIADDIGVPIAAGSDAGSFGVVHGKSLIDEIWHFVDAGLSIEHALRSATSTPRRLWGVPGGEIAVGAPADLISLSGSPFDDMTRLYDVCWTMRAGYLGNAEEKLCN